MLKTNQGIEVPRSNDVLLGRGAGNYNHHGNIVFRQLIDRHKPLYSTCTQFNKNAFAQAIVEAIWGQDPEGRFVEKNKSDSLWYEVESKVALRKAQQCLREPLRKSPATTRGSGESQHHENQQADSERLLSNMTIRFSAALKKGTSPERGGSDVCSPSSSSLFEKTQSRLSPSVSTNNNSTSSQDHSGYSDFRTKCPYRPAARGMVAAPSSLHFDDTYKISRKPSQSIRNIAAELKPMQTQTPAANTLNSAGAALLEPIAWESDSQSQKQQQSGHTSNLSISSAPAALGYDDLQSLGNTNLQSTSSADAANMVALLSRVSTGKFAFSGSTSSRRLSGATNLHRDLTPIPFECCATNLSSSFGRESHTALHDPPPQQGQQAQPVRDALRTDDLMADFDDSPFESRVRRWSSR